MSSSDQLDYSALALPATRDEAAAEFKCTVFGCRLSGVACASRHRAARGVSPRKGDPLVRCSTCPAGAARVTLLPEGATAEPTFQVPRLRCIRCGSSKSNVSRVPLLKDYCTVCVEASWAWGSSLQRLVTLQERLEYLQTTPPPAEEFAVPFVLPTPRPQPRAYAVPRAKPARRFCTTCGWLVDNPLHSSKCRHPGSAKNFLEASVLTYLLHNGPSTSRELYVALGIREHRLLSKLARMRDVALLGTENTDGCVSGFILEGGKSYLNGVAASWAMPPVKKVRPKIEQHQHLPRNPDFCPNCGLLLESGDDQHDCKPTRFSKATVSVLSYVAQYGPVPRRVLVEVLHVDVVYMKAKLQKMRLKKLIGIDGFGHTSLVTTAPAGLQWVQEARRVAYSTAADSGSPCECTPPDQSEGNLRGGSGVHVPALCHLQGSSAGDVYIDLQEPSR